jgi:integrase
LLQLEHLFLNFRLNPNDTEIQNTIIEQKEKLANEFNLLIKEAIKNLPKNTFIFNHFLKVADYVNENTIFSKFQTNQISSKTAIYNKLLKKIGKLAEIETPLTSHIYRHSFANMALSLSDDIYSISKSLGHSSLKQTEEYLRDFDFDKVNKLNEDISHSLNRFVVGKNPNVSFNDFVELTKATNDI